MISAAPAADMRLDRLVVKSGGSTRFVRVADIDNLSQRVQLICPTMEIPADIGTLEIEAA